MKTSSCNVGIKVSQWFSPLGGRQSHQGASVKDKHRLQGHKTVGHMFELQHKSKFKVADGEKQPNWLKTKVNGLTSDPTKRSGSKQANMLHATQRMIIFYVNLY